MIDVEMHYSVFIRPLVASGKLTQKKRPICEKASFYFSRSKQLLILLTVENPS